MATLPSSLKLSYVHTGQVHFPPGARLSPRLMTDYEFVWIQRGQVVYHCEGQDYPAPPGTFILARPGFHESYTWDPVGPTRHAFFHFNPLTLPADFPPPAQWPLIRQLPENELIPPLFAFIVAHPPAVYDGAGQETTVPATLVRAIETLLSEFILGPTTRGAASSDPYPPAIDLALAYAAARLTDNPAAAIDLADLARAAHVSAKHLCRVFAGRLQSSPMRVILALRLRHALQLLERTDLKIEVIGRQCGFASLYHFSRRCRDVYGVPPSILRQQMASGQFHSSNILRLTPDYSIDY
ncbi:MAG: helix-turn-helix transcriptional regulator [Phycisphaerae bacterium]